MDSSVLLEDGKGPDEVEIARLARADARNWWVLGRRALLSGVIAECIANGSSGLRVIGDFGCGSGGMWVALKDWGKVIGIDRSPLAMSLCRSKGYTGLAMGAVEKLPLGTAALDVVVMTDVLEHVQDDALAIRECARVLRPGGVLILTVPALPFLYSQHDRVLGHFRRYSRRRLVHLLRQSNLQVERITYFNAIFAPLIVVWRLFRPLLNGGVPRADPLDLPGVLNLVGLWGMTLERWALRRVNLPLGLSLLCVATNSARGLKGE